METIWICYGLIKTVIETSDIAILSKVQKHSCCHKTNLSTNIKNIPTLNIINYQNT